SLDPAVTLTALTIQNGVYSARCWSSSLRRPACADSAVRVLASYTSSALASLVPARRAPLRSAPRFIRTQNVALSSLSSCAWTALSMLPGSGAAWATPVGAIRDKAAAAPMRSARQRGVFGTGSPSRPPERIFSGSVEKSEESLSGLQEKILTNCHV